MLADPIPHQIERNGQAVAHGGDNNLHVTFYTKAILLAEQSKQQGRPVTKEQVFCRILTPGDAQNIWDQPVRDSDKRRFPKHWEAFEQGREMAQDGTPLEMWPRMTASKVLAYKSVHINTVEGVAGTSDGNSSHLPMDWLEDRLAARAYLQAAADSSVVQRQAVELAERDAEIARLKANLADVGSKVDALLAAQAEAPAKAKK